MKILFVLYDYLPSGSAEAGIVGNLVENFKNKNDQISITILTAKNDINQESFYEENRIKIYRLLNRRGFLLNKIPNRKLLFKLSVALAKIRKKMEEKNKSFLSKQLITLFYKGLKRIKAFEYDIIIPVCAYFEMYLAVERYCKEYKVFSKIVLYQLDPLTARSYNIDFYNERFSLEKSFENIDLIITTDIIKKQKENFGINISNVETLDFPCVKNNIKQTCRKNIEPTIIFAGNLHEKIRNPVFALELFSKINSPAKLYLIGNGAKDIVEHYANEYPTKIIKKGAVPATEAQDWISEADILLNIGNNDINFVPSKIFDYISTGKPIINIYKDRACPTLKYFSKYDNVISIYEKDDMTKSIEEVEKFIHSNLGKVVPFEIIERNFRKNTVEYAAKFFIYELNELLKDRN